MEKQYKSNDSLKDLYKIRGREKMYNFILSGGEFRGKILHATRLIQEMKANHNLGVLETLVLGHAYMGCLIMASQLKEEGRIQLNIECAGPIKGLSVEADSHGTVRGYLKENPIPLDKPLDNFDTNFLFGPGFLNVSRIEGNMKVPHTSQVMLEYGNISKDLASFYLESEQIPSLFNLSIKFDKEGHVISAGALFLQVMPGTGEKKIEKLEKKALEIPSLGDRFSQGVTPAQFLQTHFKSYNPEILETKGIEFFCQCSKNYYKPYLKGLKKDDKSEILEKGPFPMEIVCHNCNSKYYFEEKELKELFRN
jgi:molecular chaperone Hsp33